MWKDERRWVRILYIMGALLLLFTLVRGYAIAGKQVHTSHEYAAHEGQMIGSLENLDDDWILVHEDGREEVIELPYEMTEDEAFVEIRKDVTGLFADCDTIKFDNCRQGVVVLADGEILHEVNTSSLTRQLVFTDYVVVTVPHDKDTAELSLKFVYKMGDHFYLPQIQYGSFVNARNDIIYGDLLTLVLLSILSLFALLVIFIYLLCKVRSLKSQQVFDLLLFILTAMIWGYTDSYLPTFMNIPQEVVGILCYLSIMALPIPMCHFVWLSTGKRSKSLWILSLSGTVNVTLQAILSCFGLIQLQNTFYVAHVLIILVVIAAFVSIVKSRKEMFSLEADVIFGGIVTLAITSFISMSMYWLKGGLQYRCCMLIGTIFFSLILCASVVIHYVKRIQEDELKLSEHLIHERLSMYDVLTGLPNRRSFEEKMEEIDKTFDENRDAILVMLDVNGLKNVNDQFGHNAGDDLIVAASKVILATYGEKGSCYRIGGDEFVVILTDLSIPMTVYELLFNEQIARMNVGSRWKLSIASGYSHLTHVSGQRLSISDWKQEADINMYRAKVSMTGGHTRETAKELKDIINCIVSTVEAKDMYTAAHSNRVRELAYCIAQRLGVSDSTLQNIEIAAQLHDIGKVGVPDHILQKPGKLTDEEYEKIKLHCQIGSHIIGQAKGMQDIAQIVLHHHERWDGRGYPEGLSKEDIPLESRIIAIADSIDAITSKRIYRDSMTLDTCYHELEKNIGVMYDPAIAQIVLLNWSDIVDIVLRHPKYLIKG